MTIKSTLMVMYVVPCEGEGEVLTSVDENKLTLSRIENVTCYAPECVRIWCQNDCFLFIEV